MNFTHLHLHTEYSLLDGAIRISALPQRLKELGMNSCAITDHGVMYGDIAFYHAMRAAGLKPIIGCEVYVAPRTRYDKDNVFDKNPHHLVLLCEDLEGYHNLVKLVSAAFTEGFYYKPRVDKELLAKHHKGLIALSACLGGEIAKLLLAGERTKALAAAQEYENIFGHGNFFLELQQNGIPAQNIVNSEILTLSRQTNIPVVATNDCHYLRKEDNLAQEVLLCIQTNKTLDDPTHMSMQSDAFYVKSPEEMAESFANIPEAIANTEKIAERCNLELEFNKLYLPKFEVPDDGDPFIYLKNKCEEGLKKRLKARKPAAEPEVYAKRLQYELQVIRQMGYVDYFLVVADFIAYARRKNIMVGPGRGSGAGSLVSYCLYITMLDPIKYDLLFERFLNPERVSLPDLDIDFCYERRQEVIDYVINKYGKEHVSQVVTFGTLKARAVVRDVGRALGLSYAAVDAIAKTISPAQSSLQNELQQNAVLADLYKNDQTTKKLLDIAGSLENMPRHSSVHAAGIIISGVPIAEVAPLAKSDDTVVVQYSKDYIESVGLLKFDFLALRNLTALDHTRQAVWKNHGVKLDFDTMECDDPEVYKMIANGGTAGVFQLESEGMTAFMSSLKPESLEDITAGISLYRPGPMDSIEKYVRAKNDAATISYEHPLLEPILQNTYGCIVYQEQVLEIVRSLAGFSLGQADNIRRAMSKKKPEMLAKYHKLFVEGGKDEKGRSVIGACHNGVPESTANHIFSELMAFAGYAFNKSHAASYAVLAYQTAYCKHYYPSEFFAAMLNAYIGSDAKVVQYNRALQELHIKLLKPDINRSSAYFATEDGDVRYGLGAVKNVGIDAAEAIVSVRNKNGNFKSYGDFLRRISKVNVNSKAVESLIKASALDEFGVPRSQMLAVLDIYLKRYRSDLGHAMPNQLSFFDIMPQIQEQIVEPSYPDIKEFSAHELYEMEVDMTGVYQTVNPFAQYQKLAALERLDSIRSVLSSLEGTNEAEAPDVDAGFPGTGSAERQPAGSYEVRRVLILGMFQQLRTQNDRKGRKMAFAKIDDGSGSLECVIFASVYERLPQIPQKGDFAIFALKIEYDGERQSFIAEKIRILSAQALSSAADQTYFTQEDAALYNDVLQDGANASSGGQNTAFGQLLSNNLAKLCQQKAFTAAVGYFTDHNSDSYELETLRKMLEALPPEVLKLLFTRFFREH